MEKLPDFLLNHPFLFAALAAVIAFIVVTEFRRKTGSKALSPREAVQLMNEQDAIVLDLRETPDYKAGHILHAKHIPFSKLVEESARISTDKQKPLILYCRSGSVSSAACTQLKAQGYEQVYYLKNGIYSWRDENLPMEK